MNHAGNRNKGHKGEREFAKLISQELKLSPLTRNIDQVRDGGADIMTLRPFAIEVKRVEQLTIPQWRQQAIQQTTKKNPIPVLAFRQNRKRWRIQMLMKDVVKKKLVTPAAWIEMDIRSFLGIVKSLKR